MNDASTLDSILLSVIGENWTKVARARTDAAKVLGVSPGGGDHAIYELLANRIAVLAATGLLESKGDITQWRFSEIRKN